VRPAKLDRHDVDGALTVFEESTALARETGDPACIAPAVGNLAEALLIVGDLQKSRELSEEAVALSRSLGDARWVAGALNNLAWTLVDGIDEASNHFHEAVEITSASGSTELAEDLRALLPSNSPSDEVAIRLLSLALALCQL
jgi:Tetratricopeptide repeat